MRVFVDTSSLFKKYLDEPGSDLFDKVLAKATEIAVSPVTWIEIHAAIERCVRNRLLPGGQAEQLRTEVKRDFAYFSRILWNENLEEKAIEFVHKHVLKTLDSVQLASAVLSESELFVTSDRKLFKQAGRVIRQARFI